MDALWDTIKEDNDTLVRQKCEDTLEHDSLKSSIEEKIMNKDYETPGGYRKFQRDVERLREGYTSILRDFDEKEVWRSFEIYTCTLFCSPFQSPILIITDIIVLSRV
jgi:hypothetical protein